MATVQIVSAVEESTPPLGEGDLEVTAVSFTDVTQRGYDPSQLFPYIYSAMRVGKVRQTFWSPQAAGANGEWNYSVVMNVAKDQEALRRVLGRAKLSFTVYNKPHLFWFSSKVYLIIFYLFISFCSNYLNVFPYSFIYHQKYSDMSF